MIMPDEKSILPSLSRIEIIVNNKLSDDQHDHSNPCFKAKSTRPTLLFISSFRKTESL